MIQKLENLKNLQELLNKSPNNFLSAQIKNYATLLELQINDRLYFQPHDVLEKSPIETLHFALEKSPKLIASQSLTNPYKICETFGISSAQFEWVALNQRAKAQSWKDLEILFEKTSSVLKKKTFSIHIPLEIAILRLFELKAPQAVLNSFLQHVDDPERRLTLSRKVGAIHSIVDSLAALKGEKVA